MLVLLIEPYYETFLHSGVFGFRRGRSQIHAAAELYILTMYRQKDKTLLLLNIKKYSNQILSSSLKRIQVPLKFRKLTDFWISGNLFNYAYTGDIVSVNRSVSLSSKLGPLFMNILLNGIKDAAYSNPKHNKNFVDISNHCLSYVDDIAFIFKVDDLSTVLNNINKFLVSIGLLINKEKMQVLRFKKKKLHFNYLGFCFIYIPNSRLKLGGLVQKYRSLYDKKFSKEFGNLLVTISQEALSNIKIKIKKIIKTSYNLSVSQLIDKLNPILKGFSTYFN
jgi:RNA-directed DNA polymerase